MNSWFDDLYLQHQQQIVEQYQLPLAFSSEILEAAEQSIRQPDDLPRVDARHLDFMTIDGPDAKDFDDALALESHEQGGWNLYVAIADVSHYVRPHTPLDTEAQKRGCSIYFPNQVIPMLPEILSNEWCSLKAGIDRKVMIFQMRIQTNGQCTDASVYAGTICVRKRWNYDEVNAIIDADENNSNTALFQPYLQLYQALKQAADSRSMLDMDIAEQTCDQKGNFHLKKRGFSHRLVELCMIAANVVAAQSMRSSGMYRIHPIPSEEKLLALRQFCKRLGLSHAMPSPCTTQYLKHLLQSYQDHPAYCMLQMMILRSLGHAMYHPTCELHFGLSLSHYTHATSPIRRYPDLCVHRLLKSKNPAEKPNFKILRQMALRSTELEKRADDAMRDLQSRLKCASLTRLTGTIQSGWISGVSEWGLFVHLTEHYIDGLIHIRHLPGDGYQVKPEGLKRRSVVYAIGDKVEVRLEHIDPYKKRIDLSLIKHQAFL